MRAVYRLIVGVATGSVLALLVPMWSASAGVAVSRNRVDFEVVEGGWRRAPETIRIDTTEAWTATVPSSPSMLSIDPKEGAGAGSVTVQLVSWWVARQKPGTYTQAITVSGNSGSTQVQVTLKVVPQLPPPAFSYPFASGANACRMTAGLPDPAVCDVPGEKPPGDFSPPPQGGSYVDPNFGALVRIVSGPRSIHGYASPSAISAANKYILVLGEGEVRVMDLRKGTVQARPKIPFEGTMWDATNPALLYYCSGARMIRYNVETGKSAAIADYSGPPHRFTKITSGATGDTSKDNWASFFAPTERSVCAVHLESGKTYCASYANIRGGPYVPDYSTISKGVDSQSGKRYVLLMASPATLIFTVNEAGGNLELDYWGAERPTSQGNLDGNCDPGEVCFGTQHADTFEDSDGIQYLATADELFNPCGFYLVTYRLNAKSHPGERVELGGGMRVVMQLYRCGGTDNWADLHIGCAKSSPYCVVSTTYGRFNYRRPAGDANPIKRTPHLSEVLVMRGNGIEIRRLAEHRSVPLDSEPDRSYWTTPRACLSPDGAYVAADSNFGEPNAQRVILIETGFGKAEAGGDGPPAPPPSPGTPP